jgi:hypothetical protein
MVRAEVIQYGARLAVTERKVDEHSQAIGGLREALVNLDRRVSSLEVRVDQRFDALDHKMTRQFHWLVGILVSALIAMLGVIGGIAAVALGR